MRIGRNTPLGRKLAKDHGIKPGSKLGNTRTECGGRIFDSRFEADVGAHLELWIRAGLIAAVDYQYTVEMWAHDSRGDPKLRMNHKVDFRIQHNDGSYELLEAKGMETADWRWRRKWLEALWLPDHPDHRYTVVKDLNQLNRAVIPHAAEARS